MTDTLDALGSRAANVAATLERDLAACCAGLALRYTPRNYAALFLEADSSHGYRHVPEAARAWCNELEARGGPAALELYHKSVLAGLIADAGKRVAALSLPPSVVTLVTQSLGRILAQLGTSDPAFYRHENDLFAKDFAQCRFKLLSCGAELVDPCSGVPRSLLLRAGVSQAVRGLRFFVLRAGGFRNWYESHWDRRAVRSFTPRGYDECYLRVAELLRLNPHIRGLMSSSWWFDPALDSISPNLSFLRTVPQDNGAQLFRVGTNADATADALARSPERTRLHAAGSYQPTVYMLAWERRDLLNWAGRQGAGR